MEWKEPRPFHHRRGPDGSRVPQMCQHCAARKEKGKTLSLLHMNHPTCAQPKNIKTKSGVHDTLWISGLSCSPVTHEWEFSLSFISNITSTVESGGSNESTLSHVQKSHAKKTLHVNWRDNRHITIFIFITITTLLKRGLWQTASSNQNKYTRSARENSMCSKQCLLSSHVLS